LHVLGGILQRSAVAQQLPARRLYHLTGGSIVTQAVGFIDAHSVEFICAAKIRELP